MGAERQRLRIELLMLRARPERMQRFLIEFEMLPGRLEGNCAKGLPQTRGYRARCAADAARLVMSEQCAMPRKERGFRRSEECGSGSTETWGT